MAVSRALALVALLALAAPAAAENTPDDAETTVGILMFDGVQIIDFAAPYEVFGQARFRVYTVSADGGPVTTAMGLSVNVDYAFDDAPAADIILVPGGDVDATRAHAPTLAWLQARSEPAEQVLSVCTGAFVLADAGLLDGRDATTFHRSFDYFEREFPAVTLVRDQRWVEDGEIVTSAGLASGIDAALHVVATRLGERKARAIALHLEYDWDPDQGFVRGLMADRHVRMPASPLQLPEGTDIDTELQVGDERQWDIEYRVSSPWSPAQLITHLTELAQADEALTVVDTDDPLATAWRYDAGGEPWTLRFTARPAEDDGVYAVAAELRPQVDGATSGPLFDELAEMDRIVFQNAFVECDADTFRSLFTEDAEFYHDKAGPTFGDEARTLNGCPANDGVRRILVPDSLRVYPMAGYGAIQSGEHWFVEQGAETSTLAKFVTLWKRVDGEWRMARVLSFDHQSHPKREGPPDLE